jgi:hypothetical protein
VANSDFPLNGLVKAARTSKTSPWQTEDVNVLALAIIRAARDVNVTRSARGILTRKRALSRIQQMDFVRLNDRCALPIDFEQLVSIYTYLVKTEIDDA